MKKLLTLAIAVVMVAVAQAASISWVNTSWFLATDMENNVAATRFTSGAGGTAVSTGFTAYFINETWLLSELGVNAKSDLIAILDGGGSIDSYHSGGTGPLRGSGSINAVTRGLLQGANFAFTYIDDPVTPSSASMANYQDQFFVLVTANIGGVESYMFLENTTWKSQVQTDGDTPSFTWGATVIKDMDGTIVSNWQAIPEPMTIGLALAGVALLIAQRRRK